MRKRMMTATEANQAAKYGEPRSREALDLFHLVMGMDTGIVDPAKLAEWVCEVSGIPPVADTELGAAAREARERWIEERQRANDLLARLYPEQMDDEPPPPRHPSEVRGWVGRGGVHA